MFDTSKGFTIKLPPLGRESVDVSWPSDAQWAERARKMRVANRSVGRGQSVMEPVGSDEVNMALFRAIRQGEAEIDAAEAGYVIDRLDGSSTTPAELDGDVFVVSLAAHGCETVHRLNPPKLKQMKDYRRGMFEEYLGRGGSEYRIRLEPAGALYDALHVGHEGYECPVPINHKYAVVQAVVEAIDRIMDPEA